MKTSITSAAKLLISGLISASLLGCGGHTDCSTQPVLTIGPSSATANHSAKAPANSAQFQAGISEQLVHPSNSCALPGIIEGVQANWTVSDASKATISSAKDSTNGTATCIAASTNAITVTASTPGTTGTLTATATLNCE